MNLIEQNLDDIGILTIMLHRPEKLNALNDELLDELTKIFAYAQQEPNIKALLLTGMGKAFCAGADLIKLNQCNAQSGYEFACKGQEIFHQLESLGKPSIAAIHGFALGGGCELAMAATLRIATSNAQFGQPEIKLGVIPGYGGTQRLARLIGKGRALDLCLTGRFINAETALNWGLITHIFPSDSLIVEGKKLLQQIITLAPLALTSIMEVINYGYDLSLAAALHLEAVHFAKVCASKDKQEGVSAFLQKRQAVFTGE